MPQVAPVFRAEKSLTNRHLTEYTGLDYEMAFQDHYSEVLDVTSDMFCHIFDNIKAQLGPELEAIRKQARSSPTIASPLRSLARTTPGPHCDHSADRSQTR